MSDSNNSLLTSAQSNLRHCI